MWRQAHVVRCPSGYISALIAGMQGAYTIISLLDGMNDIIHPPPIRRCQADHPLRLLIRKVERNIFNLPSADTSDTPGQDSSH